MRSPLLAATCLLIPLLAFRTAQDPPILGTVVAEGAIQPQVAVDAEGAIYVAFIQAGDIRVAVSRDAGRTFSDPVTAIDAKGTARGGRQRGPRIAVDEAKNVYVTAPVCYDPEELKRRYPKAELWLAVSKDEGRTFAEPRRINEADRQAAEALHWLDVSPKGDLHVAWIDGRSGAPAVYYKKLGRGGEKPERDRMIAQPVCPCCAPAVVVDAKGNPTVAFREGADKPSREIFAVRSANGGRSFGDSPRMVNRMPSRVPG